MQETSIEWAEMVWNPSTGCSKVSPGCKNCYAERIAERFKGSPAFPNAFDFNLRPERYRQPLKWKSPKRIFVNSMSDLFHEQMPLSDLKELFGVMKQACWHQFLILTKRDHRLAELAPDLDWSPNIWMGVSIESQPYAVRTNALRKASASIRFLSCEPLLGPLQLDLEGIHWVICGGESGPRARSMDPEWARSIRDQCGLAGIAFFMKQMSGVKKGQTPIPADLFIRQFPLVTDAGILL
jgi:protein gp37